MKASCAIGALFNNADDKTYETIRIYGRNLGLAFQIVDDILDITQDSAILGKTAGKDVEAEKITYPSLMGLDNAKKKASELIDEAKSAVSVLKNHNYLLDFADFMVERQN